MVPGRGRSVRQSPVLDRIVALARRTPNRGLVHIFLGHPRSDGGDKTTVEPGNTFSPGMGSCGVALWTACGRALMTPDRIAPGRIAWSLDTAASPVCTAIYAAGPVTVTHRLTHLGGAGSEGADLNEVIYTDTATAAVPVTACIVVRGRGPAGGAIQTLAWDRAARQLTVNGAQTIAVEAPSLRCVLAPTPGPADMAVIHCRLHPAPGRPAVIRFKVEHGFGDGAFGRAILRRRPFARTTVAAGFRRAAAVWRTELPARLFAPDPRIAAAWERCGHHILAAMECGLPRIGAVNYPVFWIRDCVIVLRALDLMGRHDLARTGADYLAPLLFGGGFGAESDAPGEGIWALAAHGRMTRDRRRLKAVFPFIEHRVTLLDAMRTARVPLRAMAENRTPAFHAAAGVNILCRAARTGFIHGRMDWHSPDFYINCRAAAGMQMAAYAAAVTGRRMLARRWARQASAWEERIGRHLLPGYGNPRDLAVTPHPATVLAGHPALRRNFERWYHYETVAVPAGTRAVWVRYMLNSTGAEPAACSIYAVRMEARVTPAAVPAGPLAVTFTWKEVQADRTLIQRSHTQVAAKLPCTYTVNVGGTDHPMMESLAVAMPAAPAGLKTGYSDGRDAGGERFAGRWLSFGRNLAVGKPYTVSVPSGANWEAGDPDGKKLTDGVAGPPYTGGTSYRYGAIWGSGQNPVITLDLGADTVCAAFGLNIHGYPGWDALKGEVQDTIKVLTSADGQAWAPQGSLNPRPICAGAGSRSITCGPTRRP
ncbi:MAG: hypothetical protein ABIF71_10230 [Planctomycetota bacterium]